MAGCLSQDWRPCDGASFAALQPWISKVLYGTALGNDVILLDGSSETTGQLAALLNTGPFRELRESVRQPWKPLLWDVASSLEDFTMLRFLLTVPPSVDSVSAHSALRGGLVALWKASATKHLARTRWRTDHYLFHAPELSVSQKQLDAWLDMRDVRRVLLPREDFEDTRFDTGRWEMYRFADGPQLSNTGPGDHFVFHGMHCYSVRSVLSGGKLLPSDDSGLGHEFQQPGVYTTRDLAVPFELGYARPVCLFDNHEARAVPLTST